jgi:hypothetical protein
VTKGGPVGRSRRQIFKFEKLTSFIIFGKFKGKCNITPRKEVASSKEKQLECFFM